MVNFLSKNMSLSVQPRNTYIDFLRAFGLLLLVVAHTWPPIWLGTIRTFDVPLMVFISAICYKPLRGGYLTYEIKRLKRIYIPVSIFLTLFFLAIFIVFFIIGKPMIEFRIIIGSYLLFNNPSIGYVWIMRVFLMIALILPLLHKWLDSLDCTISIIVIFAIIGLQHYLVGMIYSVDNKIIRFILDETLLYAFGYCSVAVLGLKIRQFRNNALMAIILISGIAVFCFVCLHNWTFDPQQYKYPPQSLYLLYGIFASSLLWSLKSVLEPIAKGRFFAYLSENSMWIYLWHIIPVYAISHWSDIPNMWLGRYCIVLISAVCLNYIYQICVVQMKKIYKKLV